MNRMNCGRVRGWGKRAGLSAAGALVCLSAVLAAPVLAGEPEKTAPESKPEAPAPEKRERATPAVSPPKKSAASGMLDDATRARAEKIIARAEQFLVSQQDAATGGWSVPKATTEGKVPPHLPGITGLVLKGLAMNPKAKPEDPVVSNGVKYLLSHQREDGGVYDGLLPSYNTALSVSALSRVNTPAAKAAMNRGIAFLRKLQFGEDADPAVGGTEASKRVPKEHPFYGGVGYGRSGRPDASNLNIFLDAMQDAGVSGQDEAVKRAIVFLQRLQMDDRVNSMPYAKGSRQGGFVYATVENAQSIDGPVGQSMAGKMDETLSDGTVASRLRAYGSMTYAGFKSYLYAELPKDDQRVQLAMDWIRRNYTVDENPGIGKNGMYYYYVVFSRALKASGERVLMPAGEDQGKAQEGGAGRDWRVDLITKLESLQKEDGSFTSVDGRWMEDNAVLITAYALLALRHATE